MDEKSFDKIKSTKKLAIAMAAYTSASIFAPLVLIGGIGLWLDKLLGTKPIILFISVFVAFITTNLLLYKKTKAITRWIDKKNLEAKLEEEKKAEEKNKEINEK